MSQTVPPELLKCDSVELRVGYRSLIRKFSLELHAGESAAVVGPNGLGKTTLLRALCGISRPYRGNVYLGKAMLWPEKSDDALTDVCFLASQPALFAEHSVLSNLEFYLRSLGRPFDPHTVKLALKECALAESANQTARTLSTGQKRRLTLAFIMLAQPRLIFLDEPTNGLDSKGVELCLSTLDSLRKVGSGILVATHDHKLMDWCGRQIDLKEWAP
ncbi:MAG: ABC transporter ATP-binding protein [Betaproteobacteria bacterium]|nr:ABC transporter ATP-binding protein [Betaproteobacteria bacterium]